jgi:hypothetical protein
MKPAKDKVDELKGREDFFLVGRTNHPVDIQRSDFHSLLHTMIIMKPTKNKVDELK